MNKTLPLETEGQVHTHTHTINRSLSPCPLLCMNGFFLHDLANYPVGYTSYIETLKLTSQHTQVRKGGHDGHGYIYLAIVSHGDIYLAIDRI